MPTMVGTEAKEKGWGKERNFAEGLLNDKCYFIEILPTTIWDRCYCPQLIEKEIEAQISGWYQQDIWPGNVGAETWSQVHLVLKSLLSWLTHMLSPKLSEVSLLLVASIMLHLRGFKLRGGCNHSKLPILSSFAQRQTWMAWAWYTHGWVHSFHGKPVWARGTWVSRRVCSTSF